MPVQLQPNSVNTPTLQSYLDDTQRLLHDSGFRFCSQAEMIDYINKARRKVAAETGCNRQIVTAVPIDINVGSLDFLNIFSGRRVIGLLDVYLNYSQGLRPPLRYFPYSQFARSGVVMQNWHGTPELWSQVGSAAYWAPLPPIAYTMDFDASVEPLDLVNLTDVDGEVTPPYSEAVAYYAAYRVKIKDQRREEAMQFLNDYMRERNSIAASTIIRKLKGQ
jgi:hypothetical protein